MERHWINDQCPFRRATHSAIPEKQGDQAESGSFVPWLFRRVKSVVWKRSCLMISYVQLCDSGWKRSVCHWEWLCESFKLLILTYGHTLQSPRINRNNAQILQSQTPGAQTLVVLTQNHLENLWKHRFLGSTPWVSGALGWGLRICISNELPDNPDAAHQDHTWRISSMINWVTSQNLYWCDLSKRIFSNSPGDSNVQPWLKTILNQWFMASSDNYSLVRLCARHHVKVQGTFRSSADPWTVKGNIELPKDIQWLSLSFWEVKLSLYLFLRFSLDPECAASCW